MDIKILAREVSKMREYQKQYFALAARARRSNNHPLVIAEKKRVLETSKQQEKRVDALLNQVLTSEKPPELF